LFSIVQHGVGDESSLSGQQRLALLDAYAGDLHLNDETNLVLESYLIENENIVTHDTE
jgi:hypothetical protein